MRRYFVLALVGSGSLLGYAGCKSEASDTGCHTEADCRTDELCDNGKCVPIVVDSGVDSASEAGDDAPAVTCLGKQPSPTAGGHCACSTDCDAPELCLDEAGSGAPGGICVRNCSKDACPSGTVCLQLTPGAPGTESCMRPCSSTDDCQPGQLCANLETNGQLICTEYCQADGDCPVLGKCDRYTGLCSANPDHTGTKDTGEPCTDDKECSSEFCIAGVSQFPGGYCTAFCSLERQGCPDGSHCLPIWASVGDQGLCLHDCTDVSECRTGYGCVSSPTLPGVKVCRPP